MEDFEQRIQQWRKEDHERKQRFDEERKLLREKEKEIDKKILKSLSNLAQSIREFQEASDSSVAFQVCDEKPQEKSAVVIVEQLPQLKQTATVEVFELPLEKVNPENTNSYSINLWNLGNQDIPLSDAIEAPKPNPTFRSPLPSNHWPQTIHSCTKTTTETIPILLAIQKPTPTFRSPITNPNKHEFNPIPTDFSVVPSMNLSSNGADMVTLIFYSSLPLDSITVETFLLGTFGRFGPVARVKMKCPNTKLDQGDISDRKAPNSVCGFCPKPFQVH